MQERRRSGHERFTERVRQELAGDIPGRACDATAQLTALLALGATIAPVEDVDRRLALAMLTPSGAVARNLFRLVQSVAGASADLEIAPRGRTRRSRYRVRISEAAPLLDAIGVSFEEGAISARSLEAITRRRCDRVAFARGALLASGSISQPGRAPHLEVVVRDRDVADVVAVCVGAAADHEAGVSPAGTSWRVVLKSGEAIGTFLAALGAQRAFLEHDERRLRRQLRNEANRLANADSANLRRAISAAADQVDAVERALDRVGWDALGDDLREIALARLANPEATISEIGELCDPPVGKSTVHRRLVRLEQLAEE